MRHGADIHPFANLTKWRNFVIWQKNLHIVWKRRKNANENY